MTRPGHASGGAIPYLFIGSLVAVLVMCLLPNAGSFGMAVSTAMIFGLVSLMFLDTSINMAMQPFKMMVGDMVNEKQKDSPTPSRVFSAMQAAWWDISSRSSLHGLASAIQLPKE